MAMLKESIEILAFGAIIFSVVEIYLTLNKLWSRKHIQEVAESISISGRLVGMVPCIIFTLNYFLNRQWQGFIDGSLWLAASFVQIMIGAGVWVATNKKWTIMKLLKNALTQETQEISNLAKSLFQKQSHHQLIDLLASVALVDHVVNPKEKEFIENLAIEWEIPISWTLIEDRVCRSEVSPLLVVSEELHNFLEFNPSKKELKLLNKMIQALSEVSGHSKPEDRYILEEFEEAVLRYPSDHYKNYFQIQIVPQEKEQHEQLQTSSLKMKSEFIGSGFTYILGPYFSKNFTEHVLSELREHGYFCTFELKEEV